MNVVCCSRYWRFKVLADSCCKTFCNKTTIFYFVSQVPKIIQTREPQPLKYFILNWQLNNDQVITVSETVLRTAVIVGLSLSSF